MFKGLFKTSKIPSRLKKVSKKLSEPVDTQDLFKIATQGNKKDNDLDELIDIAESDEYVSKVMNEYSANRQTLKSLYDKLTLIGAGQYTKGHFVAASSLVYPHTLKFLLEHFDGENFSINNWDDYNSALFIANRLIEYFGKRETGKVN